MHIEEYLEKTCTLAQSLNCIVFNKYGEDVFKLSHRLSNVENKSRVNIETCYGIGSVTKIFTALGVLKLAESNDIKIANYVSDYLSDEKLTSILKNSNIKVSNLLSHTSGLCSLSISESRYNPEYYLKGRELNRKNIYDILRNVNTNKIDKPGKTFRYLNTGYILLGLLLRMSLVRNMKLILRIIYLIQSEWILLISAIQLQTIKILPLHILHTIRKNVAEALF